MYVVIYDGNCNLCVTLVQFLETLDRGQRFNYVPMQDEVVLAAWGVTAADCQQGMILLDLAAPEQRWQGSEAAEEIGKLLPAGAAFVQAYRAMPGFKSSGDRAYEFIRDNRYRLFGKRGTTYRPAYPACKDGACDRL